MKPKNICHTNRPKTSEPPGAFGHNVWPTSVIVDDFFLMLLNLSHRDLFDDIGSVAIGVSICL